MRHRCAPPRQGQVIICRHLGGSLTVSAATIAPSPHA